MRWLDGIIDSMNMSLSKLWEMDGEGRGSLVCCSSRGCKELDTTDQGNNSNIGLIIIPRQQRQRILSFVRCYSATCG